MSWEQAKSHLMLSSQVSLASQTLTRKRGSGDTALCWIGWWLLIECFHNTRKYATLRNATDRSAQRVWLARLLTSDCVIPKLLMGTTGLCGWCSQFAGGLGILKLSVDVIEVRHRYSATFPRPAAAQEVKKSYSGPFCTVYTYSCLP